ncbi:hypothetical protein BX265_5009 [Streptomyces sp. TLI_235]|nr:hypothetical protein BX265_5009 [Streptomyces sp. TLI_235]
MQQPTQIPPPPDMGGPLNVIAGCRPGSASPASS